MEHIEDQGATTDSGDSFSSQSPTDGMMAVLAEVLETRLFDGIKGRHPGHPRAA